MHLLRFTSIAGTLAAALALGACGGDGQDAQPARAAVTVKTFMFEPDPLEVERGTRVGWTNQDTTVHTVTTGAGRKPDGRTDARLAESGGEFSTSFDEPGTYRYFCSIHSGPGMEGTVIVR